MASTRVRGVDMKLEHSARTRFGQFDLGLDGGYVFSFRQSTSSDTAPVDVVNTVGNPLAFRMRATGEWYQRGWDRPGFGLSAAIDRFGGYRDPETTLSTYVRPFTTLDMRASYRTTYGTGVFDDVEIGLNASNLFNRAPPFVDGELGYDAANAQPYGRVLSLTMQKNW
jgi:iron complex outermembrane receptor protein